MSRRQQFETKTNPAQVTLEWAGAADAGYFKFWDSDRKEDVKINELTFAVLGERNCVRGWVEEYGSNAYSNEVASMKNQILTVKVFKDGKPKEIMSGKYDDIKGDLASMGIKYNKAVYVMVVDCDKIETGTVAKIMMKGAAASAWFDVKNKKDGLKVIDPKLGKKGAVQFAVPQFMSVELNKAEDEEAELAYEQVKAYFSNAPSTTRNEDTVPDHVIDESEHLVPDESDPFDVF